MQHCELSVSSAYLTKLKRLCKDLSLLALEEHSASIRDLLFTSSNPGAQLRISAKREEMYMPAFAKSSKTKIFATNIDFTAQQTRVDCQLREHIQPLQSVMKMMLG